MKKKIQFMGIAICCLVWIQLNGQVDPEWQKMWDEAVELMPSVVRAESRIASEGERGGALDIYGKIFDPEGVPAPDVILHAYHRDEDGFDFGKNDAENSTWRLQGWAKTDSDGAFVFHTIRPAADHLGREGAHIHFTIVSDKYGKQWAPKVFLSDDPIVTFSQRDRSDQLGKFGWVCDVQKKNGREVMEVNLKLKEESDF